MAECGRCGRCCQDVRLAESPDMLERAYLYWKKSPSIEPSFSEIYLIYPMLRFVREEPGEDLPYHYTCVHYRLDDAGLPSCGIHPIRPRMCRDFPYYEMRSISTARALSAPTRAAPTISPTRNRNHLDFGTRRRYPRSRKKRRDTTVRKTRPVKGD